MTGFSGHCRFKNKTACWVMMLHHLMWSYDIGSVFNFVVIFLFSYAYLQPTGSEVNHSYEEHSLLFVLMGFYSCYSNKTVQVWMNELLFFDALLIQHANNTIASSKGATSRTKRFFVA